MKTPHKHVELIKAWADGTEIETLDCGKWLSVPNPNWYADQEYRIKSEIKPDVVMFCCVNVNFNQSMTTRKYNSDNLKITFDGETGNPIRVELV